jgi:U3 small nucleolar RNA-associated protein 13
MDSQEAGLQLEHLSLSFRAARLTYCDIFVMNVIIDSQIQINEIISATRLLCGYNGNVNVVDWSTGSRLYSVLSEEDDQGESIASFCVHPNGSEIVVAMQNFMLRHYNLDSKELIRSFRSHQMPVLAMEYDSTGTLVATGSADKTVRVWDVPRGYCTHSFREHSGIVSMLKFHPDPARLKLFSASDDSTLRMYDLRSSYV